MKMNYIIIKFILLFYLIYPTIQVLYDNELEDETLYIDTSFEYAYDIPIPYPIFHIKAGLNPIKVTNKIASHPNLFEISSLNYTHTVDNILGVLIVGDYAYIIDSNFGLHISKIIPIEANNTKALKFHLYIPNNYNISADSDSNFDWLYDPKTDYIIAHYGKSLFLYQNVSTGNPSPKSNYLAYLLSSDYIGGIAIHHRRLFVANGYNGVDIYDINDIDNLKFSKSLGLQSLILEPGSYVVDVAFEGNVMHLLNNVNGLALYDFKNLENFRKLNSMYLLGAQRFKLYNGGIVVKGKFPDEVDYIAEFLRLNSSDYRYFFSQEVLYNDSSEVIGFNVGKRHIITLNENVLNIYYHSISPLSSPKITDYNTMVITRNIKAAEFYGEAENLTNFESYLLVAKETGYSLYQVVDTKAKVIFNASILEKIKSSSMDMNYYAVTCPQKIIADEILADSFCIYSQELKLKIDQTPANFKNDLLLLGVTLGSALAVITCGFAGCYISKMKQKYEELKEAPLNSHKNPQQIDSGKISHPSEMVLKDSRLGTSFTQGRKKRPAPLDIDLIESNKRVFPSVMPRLLKLEKRRKEQEKREEEERKAQALREKQKNEHHKLSNEEIDVDSIYIDN